ncbi:MAG: hypothetical protein HGA37_03970 [Lentimicrobium sp.]|nr:hypothetical protein [Lentimicrobium sp.]
MRKNFKSVILTALLLLQILFTVKSWSQPAGFVAMDDSVKLMVRFYETDTIVVVLPDGCNIKPEDSVAVCGFVFWKEKPVYVFRQESMLKKADYEKHLQYFGPCFRFSKAALAGLPLGIEHNGFSYKGRLFRQPNDAFYFINMQASRIYTCRNGEGQSLAYIGFMAGAYQFYVFSGNQIIYSGFQTDGNTSLQLNDMDALRDAYFGPDSYRDQVRGLFADFYIASSISDTSGFNNSVKDFDDFVSGLCRYLDVESASLPRFVTYFYQTREELQYFIAAPLWSTIHGKSFGDINHITGLNMDICKHEAGHSIIGSAIGKAPSAFFDEGFRQASDYYFSSEAYKHDLEVFRAHRNNLSVELITGESVLFFRGMENYSVAGIFTHHLIQLAGLEAFKAAYRENRMEALIGELGYDWQKLIDDLNAKTISL